MTRYAIGEVREYTVIGNAGEASEFKVEVKIKMTVRPYPATSPSYASGGEPPEGPEFEIVSILPHKGGPVVEWIEEQAIQAAESDDWIVSENWRGE